MGRGRGHRNRRFGFRGKRGRGRGVGNAEAEQRAQHNQRHRHADKNTQALADVQLGGVLADQAGHQDRAEQAARRASGDVKQLGIGVSVYVEITGGVGSIWRTLVGALNTNDLLRAKVI